MKNRRSKYIIAAIAVLLIVGAIAFIVAERAGHVSDPNPDTEESIPSVSGRGDEDDLIIERLDIFVPDFDLVFVEELPDIWYDAGLRAVYSDNSTELIMANDAYWKSEDEKMLIIRDGKFLPKSTGKVTIKAAYMGVIDSVEIEICAGEIENFDFVLEENRSEFVILKTEHTQTSYDLMVKFYLSNGKSETEYAHRLCRKLPNAEIISHNPSIISIADPSFDTVERGIGPIVAETPGKGEVSMVYGHIKSSVPVKVITSEDINEIKILDAEEPYEMSMGFGYVFSAVAVYGEDEGDELNLSLIAQWSSSDVSVVEIHEFFATAHSLGECELMVEFEGHTKTLAVTVVPPQESSGVFPFP